MQVCQPSAEVFPCSKEVSVNSWLDLGCIRKIIETLG